MSQWKTATLLLLDYKIRQQRSSDYWARPLSNSLELSSYRFSPAINARAAPHTAKHGILTISFILRLYIILPKDGDGFITGYLLGLNTADIRQNLLFNWENNKALSETTITLLDPIKTKNRLLDRDRSLATSYPSFLSVSHIVCMQWYNVLLYNRKVRWSSFRIEEQT